MQIPNYPLKPNPANNDIILGHDVDGEKTAIYTREGLLKGSPLPNNTVTTAAITNGSVTAAKIDFSTAGVKIFSANTTTVTLIAPYNCTFDVSYKRTNTWGFGGGSVTMQINDVTGLTTIATQNGRNDGGDTIGREISCRKVFTGGVSGSSYTFTRALTGGTLAGAGSSDSIIVTCYPS